MNKLLKNKSIRLNWPLLKDVRKRKIYLSEVSGKKLNKEELERRRGSSSERVKLLIP